MLVARHGLRSAGGVLAAPLRLLSGGAGVRGSDRLVVAPQDLRTTDPTVANDIYAGYFAFAGKFAATSGHSPFDIEPPSQAWAQALMGFGWLRHLRAADSALATANARALVDDWIGSWGRYRPGPAWEPQVVARRLISWLSQSPLILSGADRAFYKRFLRSLHRQASWLDKTGARSESGEARLVSAIAVAYVVLCSGTGGSSLRRASRRLSDELDRQILPDGGHIGRNPQMLVDLLTDLLPLRQTYASQGLEAPAALLNAIDRMMPMVRLFRHGDGSLALFNGMSTTAPDIVATLLAYTDARVSPIENAPHSGYQRLQARSVVVVVDSGPPPPQAYSGRAHAGCLSFELSDGPSRIVVNCGAPPAGGEQWRQVARSTAAHSTVTVGDTSSCRFVPEEGVGSFLGTPILSGPRLVEAKRDTLRDDDRPSSVLSLSHDGYRALFGVIHVRRLVLVSDGSRLSGSDTIHAPSPSRASGASDSYAIRFHLHPSVRADRDADGRGVTLTLADGRVWSFDAGGLPVSVEESVFFAAPGGARRSEQLVVNGAWRTTPTVEWRFERR
jgi:uncharacterized heparinase superfamily protein